MNTEKGFFGRGKTVVGTRRTEDRQAGAWTEDEKVKDVSIYDSLTRKDPPNAHLSRLSQACSLYPHA